MDKFWLTLGLSATAKVVSLYRHVFQVMVAPNPLLTFLRKVVVKNPADFIGSALGQSESQTKAILAATVGKVLIIDEVRSSFHL